MLTYIQIRGLLLMVCCGLIVMLPVEHAGASGKDAFKESGELRKRAAKTFDDVNKYVSQLNDTEQAMTRVGNADSGNLRKRYESFSKAVRDLEHEQERTTTSIDKMRSTAAEYFSAWDKANAQISDPELRYAGARRRTSVIEQYRDLGDSASNIGVRLQPFMSHLRDLNSFLGADLSLGNVEKAREMIYESRMEAKSLRERIADVQETMKRYLKESPK